MDARDWQALVRIAAGATQQSFPHKLDHVMTSDASAAVPRELHPAFYGSYDWHSAAHCHWVLAYACRRHPSDDVQDLARPVLEAHLTTERVSVELDYFSDPSHAASERPYGWAWFLLLHAELASQSSFAAQRAALEPLAQHFWTESLAYFDDLPYADWSGTHRNTAFSLNLLAQAARILDDSPIMSRLSDLALAWFMVPDRRLFVHPPTYGDFLVPELTVADLMASLLEPEEFSQWYHNHVETLSLDAAVLPRSPVDMNDPMGVHHAGLSLSRAWALRAVASRLGSDDPAHLGLMAESANQARDGHTLALTSGNFMAEHWLPSFLGYLDFRDQIAIDDADLEATPDPASVKTQDP